MKAIFDSWEVKDLIGKGNFGSVYKIEKDGDKEAMKVVDIYPQNSDFNEILGNDNREELEKKTSLVMKEIDMLYSLKGNTHIVNYIDHYIDKKEDMYSLYLRMEYLQKLDDYYGKEIESHKALSITYDILDALILCEEKGIVHGDIKPQNIMVDAHGNNKLTDFGISKIIGNEKVNNYTPAYAAPEIITDRKYTKQSDLYSLGLVIYQIYNNNLLPFMNTNFQKKDANKIIENRLNKDIPYPSNGTKELNEYLLKALHRHPEKRFQNAKEMKDELKNLEDNNLLPKVMVALPVMLAVAIKFNTFTVLGAEVAKEATKHTIIDTISSMTLTSKVIAGVVASLIIGGGAYAGYTYQGGSSSPAIKEGTLILQVGDSAESIGGSNNAKITFSNPHLSYDDGIKTDIETITEVNKGYSLIKITSDTAIITLGGHNHDNATKTLNLKSQEVVDYEENIGTPSLGPGDEIDTSELAVRGRNISEAGLKSNKVIDTIENKNYWNLKLANVRVYDASADGTSHHLFANAVKGSTIKSNDQTVTFEEDGEFIIHVKEDGSVDYSTMESDLLSLKKEDTSFFNGYTFSGKKITENYPDNVTKFIYDEDGKLIKELSFGNEDSKRSKVSEVFRIDENTLGYYNSIDEEYRYNKQGTLLHKILLTDVTVEKGGKKVIQKAMIFPGETEIKKAEMNLISMLTTGYSDTTYYSNFIYFMPFLTRYAGASGNMGTIDKDDFKTELAQKCFLASARMILEIEESETRLPQGKYKMKTEDCVKAIKDFLGVEPAFDTSKEYYEFEENLIEEYRDKIGIVDFISSYYPNTMYRITHKTEGEYTTIKFYAGFDPNFLMCTMRIKGNVQTYNFTFESASDIFVE